MLPIQQSYSCLSLSLSPCLCPFLFPSNQGSLYRCSMWMASTCSHTRVRGGGGEGRKVGVCTVLGEFILKSFHQSCIMNQMLQQTSTVGLPMGAAIGMRLLHGIHYVRVPYARTLGLGHAKKEKRKTNYQRLHINIIIFHYAAYSIHFPWTECTTPPWWAVKFFGYLMSSCFSTITMSFPPAGSNGIKGIKK